MLSWRHQSHSDAHSEAIRTPLDRPVAARAVVHMVRPRRHRHPPATDGLDQRLDVGQRGGMDLPTDLLLDSLATRAESSHRVQLDRSGVSRAQIRWQPGALVEAVAARHHPALDRACPGTAELHRGSARMPVRSSPGSRDPPPGSCTGAGAERERRVHVLVAAYPSVARRRMAHDPTQRFIDERARERGPLSFSCLPRAVVDCGRDVSGRVRASSVDHRGRPATAGPAGRCQPLDRGSAAEWQGRLRRALAEAASGAWSVPEADLARLMSRVVDAPCRVAQPGAPRPGRLPPDDAGPLDRRRRHGDDGAQPEVPRRPPRLGGHAGTRLGPLGDSGRGGGSRARGTRARPGSRPAAIEPPTSPLDAPAGARMSWPRRASCLRAGHSVLGFSSTSRRG